MSAIKYDQVFRAMLLAKGPYPEFRDTFDIDVYDARAAWAYFFEKMTGKEFGLVVYKEWEEWWAHEQRRHGLGVSQDADDDGTVA